MLGAPITKTEYKVRVSIVSNSHFLGLKVEMKVRPSIVANDTRCIIPQVLVHGTPEKEASFTAAGAVPRRKKSHRAHADLVEIFGLLFLVDDRNRSATASLAALGGDTLRKMMLARKWKIIDNASAKQRMGELH
jgi:hypothetical protein